MSQGAENCLAGVSFVITGVLDSLERNKAEDLIRKCGGRVVNTVSNKVNYIIVGDEAGPIKLTKVRQFCMVKYPIRFTLLFLVYMK